MTSPVARRSPTGTTPITIFSGAHARGSGAITLRSGVITVASGAITVRSGVIKLASVADHARERGDQPRERPAPSD